MCEDYIRNLWIVLRKNVIYLVIQKFYLHGLSRSQRCCIQLPEVTSKKERGFVQVIAWFQVQFGKKHARVSFSNTSTQHESERRVLFEIFEKLTSVFFFFLELHEKPCYYLLIIYRKMFETNVYTYSYNYEFTVRTPCTFGGLKTLRFFHQIL